MEDKGEVLYEIKPKYDFFYELTMPTGRKMKSAFVGFCVSLVLMIVMIICKKMVAETGNVPLTTGYNVTTIIVIIFTIFMALMIVARIAFQIAEYRGISYKFYKDCLVFENNFLSQTKKTIEYSNIREVEIRRSVIDRMMNFGVIIIYTNADRATGSATVLYAVHDTEEKYNKIENLIYRKNTSANRVLLETLNDNPIVQEEKNADGPIQEEDEKNSKSGENNFEEIEIEIDPEDK